MKIRLFRAELFRADRQTDKQADGQTDIMMLVVAFLNFAKAPKKKIDVDFAN
jgi:hypothetical protein